MSHSDEELLGDAPGLRSIFDAEMNGESNYVARFVGEGGVIRDSAEVEETTQNAIIKNVGKFFNFGALSSKKKGGASITKRATSLRKNSAKKPQNLSG